MKPSYISLALFFFLRPALAVPSPQPHPQPEQLGKRQTGSWTLVQNGMTGVAGMQLTVVSPTLAVIIDKVEANPLQINSHPAWAAIYNLETNVATPLNLKSNSFCAGGSFLSNGTLVNVGGNPVVDPEWGDVNGINGIRLFGPCNTADGSGCTFFEDTQRLQLAAQRWYPGAVRIFDGSILIMGGTPAGNFYTTPQFNSPSYEYFPKRGSGAVVQSAFLARTVPANLFPIAIALPDGTVFIIANNQTIIYNTETNTETRLPDLPNGVRVTSPFSGSATLLPLSPPNYTPEVLVCGGSAVSDSTPPTSISSQTPASDQCSRMVLTSAGIAAGWAVEHMLEPRIMPDTVLLPTGEILIVNGGKTGVAGYGNVANQIGQSNADNPAFTPALYNPTAPAGSRFTHDGMPTSTIARLYHSTAVFLPAGNVMIAGSNPNLNFTTTKYATEYRVEYLNPPWTAAGVTRPVITGTVPAVFGFGQQVNLAVTIPSGLDVSTLKVALMDLGYSTHATHMSARLVYLVSSLSSDQKTLTITAPPNGKVYPPGPGWVYLVVDGVVSVGQRTLVGTGGNPPVAS